MAKLSTTTVEARGGEGAVASLKDAIRIRGARQHNLKDIDLDIPRPSLTVVTGPSGSGKSSLALDTLFAEGQRRYVESLSTYAKQFLDRMEKPDVDSIDGVSPAVAIEQRNPTKTSRSTVGTATEVYDYLRLLWARAGRTHCPVCDRQVRPDTVAKAADRILTLPEGTRFQLAFPLPRSDLVEHKPIVENLRSMGFVRVFADGSPYDLTPTDAVDPEILGVNLGLARDLLVIVDRLAVNEESRDRVVDGLGTAFSEGEGEAVVMMADAKPGVPETLAFTQHFRCPDHPDVEFLEPSPQLFSYNNPLGSCAECTGFGATLSYDRHLIIPNPGRSIGDGAVDPWTMPRYEKERRRLRDFVMERDHSLFEPWSDLPADFREEVLEGSDEFQGIVPFLRSKEKKRYKAYIRVFLRRYQSPSPCPSCGGAKLREEALRIRVGDSTIAGVSAMPIRDLRTWMSQLTLSEMERDIARTILREIESRVRFLDEVGLGYLTLARQTRSLSGGEAQRINLANSLGASLVDTLYVLDEPTVGLHPRDTGALMDLLARLRDAGNTVVVVEHDPEAIERADYVIELGPESGEKGGSLVFEGTPAELHSADTATGNYVSGREQIEVPQRRRRVDGAALELIGGHLHNVQGADIDVPLGVLTVVTGVSGSGKSTLIHDILYRGLEKELGKGETSAKEHLGDWVGRYDSLTGTAGLDDVVLIDQSPIGRTPRSNPVTYIKAWDEVRRLFAEQPQAMDRGLQPGSFSFNTPGGRCEACKGAGWVEVEMVFMADVYVLCDMCQGKRYNPEVLEVMYRGKTISDVLELTIDEAIRFFLRQDKLGKTLWHLQQVGLGYLRLGQPATTLSGGEAQRLKIARELSGAAGKAGKKLYLLDEPTTGLSGPDIRKLLEVLARLVNAGNTVLVIEHNVEVMKVADWIIDMGPSAGDHGGRVVAMGTPEDVAASADSVTAAYLGVALAAG